MIEDTVTYALLQAVKATRASISPALAANGLHPGQDLLLSALWGEDGITQSDLVERLGIRSPTVSKALTRLERAGYVRREIDANRSRRVFLTPAGRAHFYQHTHQNRARPAAPPRNVNVSTGRWRRGSVRTTY
jgi:MarR family transcriptional regulator, organic hydroperoxide resistance regulator